MSLRVYSLRSAEKAWAMGMRPKCVHITKKLMKTLWHGGAGAKIRFGAGNGDYILREEG